MNLHPGQRLAHYRIVEKIGEGGMGRVFKALDTTLNRHVAIKLLPEGAAGAHPDRHARFQREAQAAAALDHPAIAVIHEVGEHEGSPYIVMQYLEGETLGDRMRRRPLTLKEWIDVATPIADGLAHAHRQGVIHRDLKPDNVMLTSGSQVKLLDFGLAKLLEPDALPGRADAELETRMATISRELTRAGKVLGTVAYMSPEQAKGDPVDHRSDLFSLGVMLYQMASGKLPFQRDTEIESLHATLKEEPRSLAELTGEIPLEVERVVRKAMEKEPGRRYQDAADLVTDLRNLARDLDSGRVTMVSGATTAVGASGSGPRTAVSVSGSRPMVSGAGPAAVSGAAPRPMWRGSRLVLGAAVVLLVVAGALFLRPWGGGEETAGGDRSPGEGPVAVIGFENLADPADGDNLGRMLMSLVTTDLAERGGLSVLSTPRVLSARKEVAGDGPFENAQAEAAAKAAGARVMIVGEVNRAGQGIMLTAQWVDVATGRSLGSHQQSIGSMDELFDLAGSVAEAARQGLGAAPEARSFELGEALTDSSEAYQAYVEGETALHAFDFSRAVEAYRRAIDADPTFALAYLRGSIAMGWYGQSGSALELSEAGLAHVGRLPQRWQKTYRGLMSYQRGEFDAGYEILSEVVAGGAEIPDAYYLLGEIQTHAARYLDAGRARRDFERALDIDPSFKVVLWHLVDDYIAARDYAAAHRLADRYLADDPEDAAAREAKMAVVAAEGRLDEAIAMGERLLAEGHETAGMRLVHLLCARGDFDRVLEIVDPRAESVLVGGPPAQRAYRGWALVGVGRLEEGLAAYDGSIETFRGGSLSTVGAQLSSEKAMLLWFLGRHDEALAQARHSLVVEPRYHQGRFILGRMQARLGDLAGARATLNAMVDLARDELGPAGRYWEPMLLAEIEAAAGDTGAARRHLDAAQAMPPEARELSEEAIVRAHVLAAEGDLDGAAGSMREATGPASYGHWLRMEFPSINLYELATLEEKAGNRAAAREAYREFLERWGRAGDAFPAVVRARERVAALGR